MSALLSREEALALMLPLVPAEGWSLETLRRALVAAGGKAIDAEILFPGGTLELIEAFFAQANAAVEAGAAAMDLPGMRLSERIRALVALRLRLLHPHKAAVRRALGVLARHPATAARSTAATVDLLWHLAGDMSADFAWYTKRATLAAVYSATLLYWLRDASDDDGPTLDFLDRRLAGTRNIGKLRQRITDAFARLPCARMAGGHGV